MLDFSENIIISVILSQYNCKLLRNTFRPMIWPRKIIRDDLSGTQKKNPKFPKELTLILCSMQQKCHTFILAKLLRKDDLYTRRII